MRNPRQVCKAHNLYSYQAYKGAELMAATIAEDISRMLLTADTKPLHERVAEYFGMKGGGE